MPEVHGRPIVLVVDPDESRRRILAQGLAEAGYEIVPAVSPEEGAVFLLALRPAVVVLPAELVAHEALAELLEGAAGPGRSILAAGPRESEIGLPRWARFLATDGLTPESFLERLRLLLLSREVGVDVDVDFATLVGELSHHPLTELFPALLDAQASGVLRFGGGAVVLRDGAPVAATAGSIRGLKAFCRLARQGSGLFHFQSSGEPVARELEDDVHTLLTRAVEDALGETPDPRTGVRVQMGPGLFSARFSPFQQEILAVIQDGTTLQAVLDGVEALDGQILHELLRLERQGVLALEEPESPTAVVTDSTADLPADEAERLGIHVLPLKVLFGDQAYLDGVDLTPREFYERLQKGDHHPSTSPPDQQEFLEVYRRLLATKDVVSIHISEHIPSATVVHARAAAKQALGESRRHGKRPAAALEVVDSRAASGALGMVAILAARMAARGLPAVEIRDRVEGIKSRLVTLFVVDTLEYLARGGRIGKAQAWFGNLLGIKPILGLEDGRVVPVDRVRGGRRAHSKLIELFSTALDRERSCQIIVAHAQAPIWADRLAGLLRESFSVSELQQVEMGPVIGAHVGPGTLGTAIFQPELEEEDLLAPLRTTPTPSR
jgi:fatty acid kinase fatty acid binding subunit